MSNKPANRPGHPIHGNQRKWLRSAKARRRLEIQINTMRNQIKRAQNMPTIKGLDKFTRSDADA